MTAHARHNDPITSHEAAATIDTSRSQTAVLQFAHEYLGDYFTQRGLVDTYQRVWLLQQDTPQPATPGLPRLSDSRLRSAVRELQRKRYVARAGYTRPESGRRETIWQLTDAETEGAHP